jgi:hypothetical protein
MVAEYTVKRNGKWYHAGDVIEEVEESASSLPFEKVHTKTEINRMNVDDLKALAAENDVPGYEDMTGTALKEYFINLLNL